MGCWDLYLCLQISDLLCGPGKPCDIAAVYLYGRTSKGPQISALKCVVVSVSTLFATRYLNLEILFLMAVPAFANELLFGILIAVGASPLSNSQNGLGFQLLCLSRFCPIWFCSLCLFLFL